MESLEFSKVLKRKAGTIFTIVFVSVVLTIGASLLFPLKYGANSRLLVVPETSGSDPYTISRSNEYFGNLLSQVVYSSSFYSLVLESSYDIDRSYFSGNNSDQIKIWRKTVSTSTISDTGIIEINIYHPRPEQARQIALAVNDVLMNKNAMYSGQGVKINMIDQPLVSSYPVKPNLPKNAAAAFAGSLMLSLFYIYLWPEEKYDLRLWKKKSVKKPRISAHSVKLDYLPVVDQDERPTQAPVDNQYRPQGSIGNILK